MGGATSSEVKRLSIRDMNCLGTVPDFISEEFPLEEQLPRWKQRWRKPFEMYLFFSLNAEEDFFPLRLWKLLKAAGEKILEVSLFLFFRVNIRQYQAI